MKVDYGELIQIPGGAVQFCKTDNTEEILLTGRFGEIRIPLKSILKAMEDSWRFEGTSRGNR